LEWYKSWIQKGLDIEGENAEDDFGVSIAMNKTGNFVIVGARSNDNAGINAGHIRVFHIETLGISGNEKNFSFNVHPNPNNGVFQVNLDNVINENVTIEIIDILGNIVYQGFLNSSTQFINLSSQVPGIYLMKIKNEGLINSARIIIQ